MIRTCRACRYSSPWYIMHLGSIPVTGYTVPTKDMAMSEPQFDLSLAQCRRCGLVQLSTDEHAQILKEKVYDRYQPTYSSSAAVQEYIRVMLNNIKHQHNIHNNDLFVEIGCNDGRTLEIVRDEIKCQVLGVEPSPNLCKMCRLNNIPVIERFFEDTIEEISEMRPRVILARHVLEHSLNPMKFAAGLRECTNRETVVVIEVPYIVSILQEFHYEGISHPHISYFSLRSLMKLLDLTITNTELVPTDGGSIWVEAQRTTQRERKEDPMVPEILLMEKAMRIDKAEPYNLLSHRIEQHLKTSRELLHRIAHQRKTIYGFGAGKGHTMLNMLDLHHDTVKCVIDDNPMKQHRFLPGCGIEVKPFSYLVENQPDYLLMLAPTHSKELKEKITHRLDASLKKRKFKFIDTIPKMVIS